MKVFGVLLFYIGVVNFTPSCAQSVTGSTIIDVDSSTNTVTATCETDNDDGDYEAEVQCTVFDDADNQVAALGSIDHGGMGYAQVVLSFSGQPGTNYTAYASHVAISNITDLPVDGSRQTFYEDPMNYSYFEGTGAPAYLNYYKWYGPGPDQRVRRKNISVGKTTARNALAPRVIIKFFGNKSSGDSLGFASGGICSEALGYVQCPKFFRYSYEGSAKVKQAANWTVMQSVVSGRTKGIYNSGGTFDFGSTVGSDGPGATYTQRVNGSPVFWLDSPSTGTSAQGDPVKSLTSVDNFSVSVCSTINKNVCGSTTYFTKIVVSGGQMTSASVGGYGSTSVTNF